MQGQLPSGEVETIIDKAKAYKALNDANLRVESGKINGPCELTTIKDMVQVLRADVMAVADLKEQLEASMTNLTLRNAYVDLLTMMSDVETARSVDDAIREHVYAASEH